MTLLRFSKRMPEISECCSFADFHQKHVNCQKTLIQKGFRNLIALVSIKIKSRTMLLYYKDVYYTNIS